MNQMSQEQIDRLRTNVRENGRLQSSPQCLFNYLESVRRHGGVNVQVANEVQTELYHNTFEI